MVDHEQYLFGPSLYVVPRFTFFVAVGLGSADETRGAVTIRTTCPHSYGYES